MLVNKFFKIKHKRWLIIRLNSIKYKKNIFCYLSFYSTLSLLANTFFFVKYQFVINSSKRPSYSNNLDIPTIQISQKFIKLSSCISQQIIIK